MEWKGRRNSRNIEDRRSQGGGGGFKRGGGGALGLIAVLVLAVVFGMDPTRLLDSGGFGAGTPDANVRGAGDRDAATREISAEDQAAGEFVSVVLADTEEIWSDLFARQLQARYQPTILVLYKGVTGSPCGGASGAVGPFYCPADRKVYLDTDFFVTLEHQLGAGGDFAAAYVVAHEVAHHVQNQLGILGRSLELRAQLNDSDANRVSVAIELQADCLSGVWAHEAARSLGTVEQGDFEEALNAARQIGDDTLARNAGQRPMPHNFTHGTSQQRQQAFALGAKTGEIQQCQKFTQEMR